MIRILAATVLAAAALASVPAVAFWQRSQGSRCSDATNEAERLQLRCWELNAYVDPGWPALGPGGGAYLLRERFAPHGRIPGKGGVTRRLG
ncbi:hypothetical protein [Bosea sp. (in: a-proteobacteria)]|uniref:hypothetical protein n=1 Tax=Bosea sp. (in: a-proteobacteria) TaxID=1871050 RepID=UPI0033429AD0